MGEIPLTEQDIYYWRMNHRAHLDSWEIRELRKLSGVYLQAKDAGEYKGAKRPYTDTENPEVQKAAAMTESMRLKAMFKAAELNQKPKRKRNA